MRTARQAGFLAFATVLVSGLAHLAAQYLPRPASTYGHIDIAELLNRTPIFSEHWPYWTFPFEYHPVIGWGSALLSYVTDQLVVLVVLWLAIVALAARAVALLLVPQIGVRRTIVFWSVAPQLLLFSGQNFDALAVFTLVFATSALRAGRPMRAGVAFAVGAATKLFPLVGAPPYLVALWRVGRLRTAVVCAAAATATLVVLDLPAVVAPFSLLSYGVTPYGVRTWNVDSIWLPVAAALDLVVAPDVADAFITAASLTGLVAMYVLVVLRPAFRAGVDAQRLAWLGVGILVFWSRLRSPQYAIWLLPLFALYVPDPRLLLFMFVGDATTFFGVFSLRGVPRDPLGPDTLPFYAAICVGTIVRQIAVMRLILRAR